MTDNTAPHIHLILERNDGHRSDIEVSGDLITRVMLDAAEDLISTLTTGERPPIKGLYELCARAFGTTREDAKKRLLRAAYSQKGSISTLRSAVKNHDWSWPPMHIIPSNHAAAPALPKIRSQARTDTGSVRIAFEAGFCAGLEHGHDTAQSRTKEVTHELIRTDLATREQALRDHLAGRVETAASEGTRKPQIRLVLVPPDSLTASIQIDGSLTASIQIDGSRVTPTMLEAAEDLLHTLTTGERQLPKDLYGDVARAFGTSRNDAKERVLLASYGGKGAPITLSPEEPSA